MSIALNIQETIAILRILAYVHRNGNKPTSVKSTIKSLHPEKIVGTHDATIGHHSSCSALVHYTREMHAYTTKHARLRRIANDVAYHVIDDDPGTA